MKLIKGIILIGAFVATILVIMKFTNTQSIEYMTLETSDNKNIAYDYYSVESPRGWIIFTHMMPATKESWKDIAEALQKEGYESVAIDLRGHGISDGGPNGYKDFSDADHQKSIVDIVAAWQFLQSRGAVPEKTALIGASIGANLSLQFGAENPALKSIVLLSPGLDYRGIRATPLIQQLSSQQRVVIATSKDDNNNSEESMALYQGAPHDMKKHIIIFDKGGHGTDLFKNKAEYDLEGALKEFLKTGEIL
ncbi:MAG: alpha/beta fold hydrolase [bacterium]|nr:alpha/beta fold hydrolase [bacterium]